MKTSTNGMNLIKKFEGCRLTAYQDSIGVWTIGYGWTQPINGKPVTQGMTITQQQADELLQQGVVQYEQGITKAVTVEINQNQFDALVSFSYNLGINALNSSTLLKKLNGSDYNGAANEFLRWNKAGGKVLPGLTRRREAERKLFLS
ncbi:lysozyme [Serratia marcescens]|uniref:lysozyme n=1 Tax=Serratia marcescens TaxID=615 RepID=UPI001EEFD1F9|nr:lysozyme [Serratia marcescens]ULH10794.1 lysozyme [Serratia marcescens]